jgi:hypothetical protein
MSLSFGNESFKGLSKVRSDVSSLRSKNARMQKLSVSGSSTLEGGLTVDNGATINNGLIVNNGLTVGTGSTVYTVTVGTISIDPGNISATTKGSVNFTLSGASTTDRVLLQPPTGLNSGLLYCGADITSSNTVTVYLYNKTGGGIDDGANTWKYTFFQFTD